VFTQAIVVFTVLLSSVSVAQAGNQLFEASWTVKARGNEITGAAGESEFYSAFGIPLGIQCNPNQPHCPFDSTPTDGSGNFAPRGGYWAGQAYCAPWSNWQSGGTTARPAKGATSKTTGAWKRPIPPLYRNPAFFTTGGEPHTTSCNPLSTGATPDGRGLAQVGNPVTGTWTAATTGTGRGGFHFAAAPKNHAAGVRVGQGAPGYTRWGSATSQGSARSGAIGDFGAIYPFIYSYTYATLRNDAGAFGPGQGPGSFSIPFKRGLNTGAKAVVKQGAAKFGGTMQMLGRLTSKGCYYRNGKCSTPYWNWRYDAIGAAAYTSGGVVTRGYSAIWCLDTGWGPFGSCPSIENPTAIQVRGARFPWTTGSVTVTAVGYPHKTVHYAKGYDNRTMTSGQGTIQLVTPVVTQWDVSENYGSFIWYTGGIGILRVKFVPEPRAWVVLIAGVALLGVLYRRRL
jgi:hypothetical protein